MSRSALLLLLPHGLALMRADARHSAQRRVPYANTPNTHFHGHREEVPTGTAGQQQKKKKKEAGA